MPEHNPAHVLLTADQIRQRVAEMAGEVARDHPEGVHLVAILKGAFVFLADLVRQMDVTVSLDFIAVSSYGNRTSSSGDVQWLGNLEAPIVDRHVVIVDDIVDTGLTLATLQQMMRTRAPRTLRTACLLSKPSRRQAQVKLDYVGFTIEDHFVVGYGLDYADRYRNLPYIAVLS